MPDAVADAGPLIHLDEVGRLDALRVFTRVHVPPLIVRELTIRPGLPGGSALDAPRVVLTRPTRAEHAAAAKMGDHFELTPADKACLAMARARRTILLTDDLDLRETAHLVGLRPVGSIGVLLRAASERIIDGPTTLAALDGLRDDSTLFITPKLIDRAKHALRAGLP